MRRWDAERALWTVKEQTMLQQISDLQALLVRNALATLDTVNVQPSKRLLSSSVATKQECAHHASHSLICAVGLQQRTRDVWCPCRSSLLWREEQGQKQAAAMLQILLSLTSHLAPAQQLPSSRLLPRQHLSNSFLCSRQPLTLQGSPQDPAMQRQGQLKHTQHPPLRCRKARKALISWWLPLSRDSAL